MLEQGDKEAGTLQAAGDQEKSFLSFIPPYLSLELQGEEGLNPERWALTWEPARCRQRQRIPKETSCNSSQGQANLPAKALRQQAGPVKDKARSTVLLERAE